MDKECPLIKKFCRRKMCNEAKGKGRVILRSVAIRAENENRLNGDDDFDDGEDRISNLPELVISNILSRLAFQEAVRTSVLSRNWISSWTSISKLKIMDGHPYSELQFLNIVEQILGKALCIKEVELLCFQSHNPSCLKALLLAILKSDVLESLYVAGFNLNSVFSPCLFDTNSLTKLYLFGGSFEVSTGIHLHRLRSLRLVAINFQNDDISSSQLIFNLPVLEEFQLSGCFFSNVKSLRIDAPRLATFELTLCSYESEFSKMHGQCAVDISGGSSINFIYRGTLMEKFTFADPSTVGNANLRIGALFHHDKYFLRGMDCRARLILEIFSASLNVLDLSVEVIEALANEPSYPFPVFDNLKNVNIHLPCATCDYLRNIVVKLLKKVPNLEALMLLQEECEGCKECYQAKRGVLSRIEGYMENQSFPEDFLSHLKTLRFENFYPWAEEIHLVKFLLEHVPVLEELRIIFKHGVVPKKLKERFLSSLMASTKEPIQFSSNCKIIIG